MRRALVFALMLGSSGLAAGPAHAERSGAFWGRARGLEVWEAMRDQGMAMLALARDTRARLGPDENGEVRRGPMYVQGEKALELFEEALKLHGDDPDLHYAAYWAAQGYMSDRSKRRHEAVIAHIDALQRLRPIHADGLSLAANYVEALGRLAWLSHGAEARKLFAQCADAYAPLLARLQEYLGGAVDGDTTYSNAAEVMMAAGRLDEALVYYRRSVATGPTRALNQYGLAMALDRAGEGESALRTMREAIRLDTAHILATGDLDDSGVYFVPRGDKLAYEALAAEAEGRRGDAARAWRRFLEEALDAQPAYKVRARQHLKALGVRP